jgi:hypothetical protein
MNIWSLIESEEFELASINADLEFQKTGSLLPLRNKIYALLMLRDYDSVEILANILIAKIEGSTSVDFISLGIAYWFRYEKQKALDAWLSALKAPYQDLGGGVIVNTILYFAAVKCQDELMLKKAILNLKKIVLINKTPRWPMPLAQFLLGAIKTHELLIIASGEPSLKERQLCQAYFTISALCLKKGQIAEYVKNLELSTSFSSISWLEQVYYLAKGELSVG